MIPVTTSEELIQWMAKLPQRNPEAYKRINGGFSQGAGEPPKKSNYRPLGAIPEETHKPWMPPPPPKESIDFKSAASGEIEEEWDGYEEGQQTT